MPVHDHTTSIEYRTIPEHEGYRFGSDGTIWSRWKRRWLGYGAGTEMVLGDEWKLMTPGLTKPGYLKIVLRNRKTRFVHQLILEAFVGPRGPRMQCRHFNGIRTDNRLENLAWGTPKQNGEDRASHGLARKSAQSREATRIIRGERHNRFKLCGSDVLQIRERASHGESHVSIAADFDLYPSSVSTIVSRRTWKNI